jgi:hypothetical protein
MTCCWINLQEQNVFIFQGSGVQEECHMQKAQLHLSAHLALFLDHSMLEDEDIMSGCLESAVCVSMEQMTIPCGRKNVDKSFC